jgi:hypothetical protein
MANLYFSVLLVQHQRIFHRPRHALLAAVILLSVMPNWYSEFASDNTHPISLKLPRVQLNIHCINYHRN